MSDVLRPFCRVCEAVLSAGQLAATLLESCGREHGIHVSSCRCSEPCTACVAVRFTWVWSAVLHTLRANFVPR